MLYFQIMDMKGQNDIQVAMVTMFLNIFSPNYLTPQKIRGNGALHSFKWFALSPLYIEGTIPVEAPGKAATAVL